ncbi:MAG: hypothetical protein WD750_00045 [Gammaproteobacteria bacterium]
MVDLAKIAKHAKELWSFTSLRTLRAWRDPYENHSRKPGSILRPTGSKFLFIRGLAVMARSSSPTDSGDESNNYIYIGSVPDRY